MRIVSFEELRPLKGIVYSRDHLRRLCDDGKFPKPIRLSSARIAWLESDVDEWIAQRAAERDAGSTRQRAKEAART
jgi:prophage regulatory protein